MPAIESALVILVPEAEVVVKRFRDKYDRSAANGCPAHVTLLYPFKPPNEITRIDFDRLGSCFASFHPFRFALAVARRFPGLLYFALEPDEPFRRLTFAIWDLYPEIPPYGGKHPDPVPHLSVASQVTDEQLDRIAAELEVAARGRLPISAMTSEVALLDTRSGRWKVRRVFKLG